MKTNFLKLIFNYKSKNDIFIYGLSILLGIVLSCIIIMNIKVLDYNDFSSFQLFAKIISENIFILTLLLIIVFNCSYIFWKFFDNSSFIIRFKNNADFMNYLFKILLYKNVICIILFILPCFINILIQFPHNVITNDLSSLINDFLFLSKYVVTYLVLAIVFLKVFFKYDFKVSLSIILLFISSILLYSNSNELIKNFYDIGINIFIFLKPYQYSNIIFEISIFLTYMFLLLYIMNLMEKTHFNYNFKHIAVSFKVSFYSSLKWIYLFIILYLVIIGYNMLLLDGYSNMSIIKNILGINFSERNSIIQLFILLFYYIYVCFLLVLYNDNKLKFSISNLCLRDNNYVIKNILIESQYIISIISMIKYLFLLLVVIYLNISVSSIIFLLINDYLYLLCSSFLFIFIFLLCKILNNKLLYFVFPLLFLLFILMYDKIPIVLLFVFLLLLIIAIRYLYMKKYVYIYESTI